MNSNRKALPPPPTIVLFKVSFLFEAIDIASFPLGKVAKKNSDWVDSMSSIKSAITQVIQQKRWST